MTGPGARRAARAGLVNLSWNQQARGALVAGEFPGHLPFVPHRFFVVRDVPAWEIRGQHAHRTCEQFLVSLTGSVTAEVWDDLGHRTYVLDSPETGLYMPAMTYGTQHRYHSGSVLLVLASDPYDVSDYLDSFDEYCAIVGRTYDVTPPET